MNQEQQRKRLRKQPKRQRFQAASAVQMPELKLPQTAQKRRRRKKTEPVRFGLSSLKRFIFSARWLSLGLLALTIFALSDIYKQQRFYLTYIPVEGSIAISPDEIAAASGLAGRHAFAADPSDAAQRIGALPGIISATVTLQWPNHVYIHVAEEAPIAIWLENGVEYGITQNGRLIPSLRANPGLLQIESETVALAPTMVGEGTPGELSAQEAAEAEAAGIAVPDAISVAEDSTAKLSIIPRDVLDGALQLHQLRPTIDKLYYKPMGGLSYEDGRGWRGYFGTGTEMNQKLAVYETVVTELVARGIQPEYISVSNQEKPFYKTPVLPGVEGEQTP